jgi:hypothetical protein
MLVGYPSSATVNRAQLVGFRLHMRAQQPEVLYVPGAGTGEIMSSETIVAASGLIALGAAVLTGAIWDSALVGASLRLLENFRSQGRHAMPR